jgi:hypothetical protein
MWARDQEYGVRSKLGSTFALGSRLQHVQRTDFEMKLKRAEPGR